MRLDSSTLALHRDGLRWLNRTPLATVVGVRVFLFLVVVALIIVGSALLMPSPVM